MMSLLLMLSAVQQENAPPIVVKAPLAGTPQTPATIVVEPAAMMIAACDADGDALVDRSELIGCIRHSFETIDTAKRGSIRYIQYADWAKKWLGDANALPSPFEVDRDNDDQITLEELQDQFSRLFARYDRDRDHVVSRTELLTFRTAPIGANGPTAPKPDDRRDKRSGKGRRGGPPPGGEPPEDAQP